MDEKPKPNPEWKPIPFTIEFREPTAEEKAIHEERRKRNDEFKAKVLALSKEERIIYEALNDTVDRLYGAGVDVSYFPDGAYDVLIEVSKELAAKLD